MFKNISWSSYGIFISVTLLVYYATVSVLYYLNDIKQIFSGKSRLILKLNPLTKLIVGNHLQITDNADNENFSKRSQESLQTSLDECMLAINNSLQYAANNHLIKPEIIYSLQQVIKKYDSLQNTSFKLLISNYILIESENYCSIHFNEDELNGLWAN